MWSGWWLVANGTTATMTKDEKRCREKIRVKWKTLANILHNKYHGTLHRFVVAFFSVHCCRCYFSLLAFLTLFRFTFVIIVIIFEQPTLGRRLANDSDSAATILRLHIFEIYYIRCVRSVLVARFPFWFVRNIIHIALIARPRLPERRDSGP